MATSTTYEVGESVRITAGILRGAEGVVVGEDDRFGENVVDLTDGEETIVPDDGLEVV